MWAIPVPILVFLGLSVLDLGPMYATDTDVSSLNAPPNRGGGITNWFTLCVCCLQPENV